METNRGPESLKHLELKSTTVEYYQTRFQIILSHSNKKKNSNVTKQSTNKQTNG